MVRPAKHLAREHLAKDFEGLRLFLIAQHRFPTQIVGSTLGSLRKAHAAAYSLFLWQHDLRGAPLHGHAYLSEMGSDAIQIIPHALCGYRKSTTLLIRSVLENLLRHIYFRDHPVEFRRANSPRDWHVRVRELQEYLISHPIFEETEAGFDAIAKVKRLYGELSRGVHGAALVNMEMRKALAAIAFEPPVFELQARQLIECAQAANFLLSAFHAEELAKFPPAHRQIIWDVIPKSGRRVLMGI